MQQQTEFRKVNATLVNPHNPIEQMKIARARNVTPSRFSSSFRAGTLYEVSAELQREFRKSQPNIFRVLYDDVDSDRFGRGNF